jgi:hypothetical protein
VNEENLAMLTNPYTRQVEEDFPDLDDEFERERERRRAANEQAMRDAQEVMTEPPAPPAPAEEFARRQQERAAGYRSLRPLPPPPQPAAALPAPVIDLPAPVVDPNPTPTPTQLPSLRPAQTSPQLADVHEFRQRLEGPQGRPAPTAEDEDERRRRKALRPHQQEGWTEEVMMDGIPTHITNVGLSRRLRELVARYPDAGTEQALGAQQPQDSAPVQPPQPEPVPPSGAVTGDPLTTPLQDVPKIALDAKNARAGLRPSMNNTGDSLADVQEYRRRLEGYTDPKAKDSRLVAGLKKALQAAAVGARATGTWQGAAGGAGVGLAYGGAVPNITERDWRDREKIKAAGLEKQEVDRRKEALNAEETRAGVRLKNAQATDLETQKPLRDAAKFEDQQKRALLAELGKMPMVDPAKNAVFLAKWKKLYGEDFNVEAWNNKKGNFIIRGLITDPAKPQEKHDIAINLGTGEQRDLGISGYTPPLDAQGMSENQRRSDSDRDDTRDNTENFRAQMLGLSTARLQESMLNGLTGRAAKTFSTKTTGLFAERGRLETQINGYRTRASKREISPAESERRIAELQKKVDEITGRIDDARSEAVGEMGGASRPRSASGPVSESYAGKRISRSKLPEAAKRLGVSVDEAERRIKAGG